MPNATNMQDNPAALPTDNKLHGDKLENAVAGATDATLEDTSPADPAPDLLELLQKAEAEVAALKDAWLRARAETDNVRKQAAADVTKAHKYALERFASDL